MYYILKVFWFMFSCGVLIVTVANANPTFVPKDGFVPDESTAVAIAEAILTPIYGPSAVQSEKPYRAKLQGEVWVVSGSLTKGHVGGVAVVRISKKDATIISVIHGR